MHVSMEDAARGHPLPGGRVKKPTRPEALVGGRANARLGRKRRRQTRMDAIGGSPMRFTSASA